MVQSKRRCGLFVSQTTTEDIEESSTLAGLSKKLDFRGWQQRTLLYVMEKGDVDGIFTDDGSDASRGYQLIPNLSTARRQGWKLEAGSY